MKHEHAKLRDVIKRRPNRRGAVAVEFAIVAPIFVSIFAGMVYVNQLFDHQDQFALAARQGARIASMDRDGVVGDGQSTNDKVEKDIRNFLNANNFAGEDVEITIAHAGDPDRPFDFDAPDSSLELFQIIVEMDYSKIASAEIQSSEDFKVGSSVVFRNGRVSNN